MTRPALLLSLPCAVALLAAATTSSAAFSVTSGYPRRDGTTRVVAGATWDPTAGNVGFNRADCFDTKQKVLLRFADLPSDATTIEIWARRDNTSCADPTQREGTGATTPQCFKVASWTRDEVFNREVSFLPLQVIQAVDKVTNVDDPAALVPATVCAKDTSMPPTQVTLQVMAFNGTTVIGFTSSGGTGTGTGTTTTEQIIPITTSYDIAGPNAPTDLTLGAGNQLLIAKFSSAGTSSTSDFKGYRAYCFPGPSTKGGALSTKGVDGGPDDATTDAATDATADGAGDTATGDGATSDASASDAAASDATTPVGCPSGVPFVPGDLPTPDLDPYLCGDESTTATGELKVSKFASGERLVNGVPYAIAIGSTDRQGNSGALSAIACATPKETEDFYGVYRRAGGTAGGGWCGYGGAKAPLGLAPVGLALAALALVRRTKSTSRFGR